MNRKQRKNNKVFTRSLMAAASGRGYHEPRFEIFMALRQSQGRIRRRRAQEAAALMAAKEFTAKHGGDQPSPLWDCSE